MVVGYPTISHGKVPCKRSQQCWPTRCNKGQHFYCFAVIEAWSNNVGFICMAHPTKFHRRTRTTYHVYIQIHANKKSIEEQQPKVERKRLVTEKTEEELLRIWTHTEIDQLIDLLEGKDCLWDVNKKDYHVRNKHERAFEEMRNILDIDVAEIKAKITSLRA